MVKSDIATKKFSDSGLGITASVNGRHFLLSVLQVQLKKLGRVSVYFVIGTSKQRNENSMSSPYVALITCIVILILTIFFFMPTVLQVLTILTGAIFLTLL